MVICWDDIIDGQTGRLPLPTWIDAREIAGCQTRLAQMVLWLSDDGLKRLNTLRAAAGGATVWVPGPDGWRALRFASDFDVRPSDEGWLRVRFDVVFE